MCMTHMIIDKYRFFLMIDDTFLLLYRFIISFVELSLNIEGLKVASPLKSSYGSIKCTEHLPKAVVVGTSERVGYTISVRSNNISTIN